jgi:hypothetical protein
MDNLLVPFLTQLASRSPILLAYVVGLILSLVFWRRYPRACLLTLIATALLLLNNVVVMYLSMYLIRVRSGWAWDPERFGWLMSAIALASSCVTAVGLGFLLAAVFAGRGGTSNRIRSDKALESRGEGAWQPGEDAITDRPKS